MAVLKEAYTKEVPKLDMVIVMVEDMVDGEVDPPLVSIVEKLVIYQGFVPNHTCFVHIYTISSMSPKTIVNCLKSGKTRRPIATQ
jgi:hypothetical protein